ncbi:MAG: DUF2842 domain-containing protein [Beijerinckiaceae bacterium]
MTRSVRKFIGTFILIVFVLAYVLTVMAIAPKVVYALPGHWQWLFYIVAGLGWVFPLFPMIRWMEKRAPGEE